MSRPSAQSRLLIVIPAWNEEEVLGDVLEMVKVEKPSFADILVVSDGSTDATADIARAAGVAVLDLPLGSTDLRAPQTYSVMVNLLGSSYDQPARALAAAFRAGGAGAKVHLYGKEVRPGRKLGHVTVVDQDPALALERARAAVSALRGDAPTD